MKSLLTILYTCFTCMLPVMTIAAVPQPIVPLTVTPVYVTATQPQHKPAPSRTKPPALQHGDCIGILGPASPLDDPAILQHVVTELQQRGYTTKLAPSATARYGFFSGTDTLRADDINTFFQDDTVKAILCLNGGYGSTRILDKLDYTMIARHPKLFIGFSDITALHTALGEKSHIVTIHGPLVATLYSPYTTDYTTRQFDTGLTATTAPGPMALPPNRSLTTIIAGTATGPIVGGNLSLIAAMAGTPYELDGTGCILFLEDVSEPAYRIDRMLEQLRQNGLFQRVNGIIFGDFLDSSSDAGDFTADEVLEYYAKRCGKPAIKNFPDGHGSDKAFLPLGIRATLQARPDGTATVSITEPYTATNR
jgi:muramoyltetrapeptide carboxypeptidase